MSAIDGLLMRYFSMADLATSSAKLWVRGNDDELSLSPSAGGGSMVLGPDGSPEISGAWMRHLEMACALDTLAPSHRGMLAERYELMLQREAALADAALLNANASRFEANALRDKVRRDQWRSAASRARAGEKRLVTKADQLGSMASRVEKRLGYAAALHQVEVEAHRRHLLGWGKDADGNDVEVEQLEIDWTEEKVWSYARILARMLNVPPWRVEIVLRIMSGLGKPARARW